MSTEVQRPLSSMVEDSYNIQAEDVKDNYSHSEFPAMIPNQQPENVNIETVVGNASPGGLKIWMAAVFIAGEIIGSGVLTLPKAADQAGILGFALIAVFGAAACYSGTKLSSCWTILMERWPEYNNHVRDPYPTIAYRCYGNKMKIVTKVILDVTLFGASAVYILIGSRLTQTLLDKQDISFCYWILIFGAILTPITWLGSPKDFWQIGIGALLTAVITVILAIISMIHYKEDDPNVPITHSEVTLTGFSLSFGTILFMYGGASTFPTIQNDMRDKKQFVKSVIFGFIIILTMYIPIALTAYLTIGSRVNANLLLSIPTGILRKCCEGLLIVHLLLAYFIVINPLCQELEVLTKIDHKFGVKRLLLRTALVGLILFTAESIPRFDYLLNFIGGSTITLLAFIFPCLFYLKLTSMVNTNGPEWPKWEVPTYEKIMLVEIIIVGVIGGCLSTYHSAKRLFEPESFLCPCYVNITAAEGH